MYHSPNLLIAGCLSFSIWLSWSQTGLLLINELIHISHFWTGWTHVEPCYNFCCSHSWSDVIIPDPDCMGKYTHIQRPSHANYVSNYNQIFTEVCVATNGPHVSGYEWIYLYIFSANVYARNAVFMKISWILKNVCILLLLIVCKIMHRTNLCKAN